MDIRIQQRTQPEQSPDGSIVLVVTLDADDVESLRTQAQRAFEIEGEIPASVRTMHGNADAEAYRERFIETRTVNDALEAYNIIPVARPTVEPGDCDDDEARMYTVSVHPRPEFRLTSLDPVNLRASRVAKPGFSAKAGHAGDEDVEFLDDEKTLRIALLERLVGELPEGAMRALGAEYQKAYELDMARRNIDPAMYREAHGLDEEQYTIMMTRNALGEARWNYALDAVFAAAGLDIAGDDVSAALELQAPGHSEQLLELHELRNDLYPTIEKIRRGKALKWLRENALK